MYTPHPGNAFGKMEFSKIFLTIDRAPSHPTGTMPPKK
jgi:hypothetical protein